MALQTEFAFTLPKGYIGSDGSLHRHGTMRLATARDEIEPLRDPRVTGPDDPYLTILVISRVITELGQLPAITVREVEGLFAADLAFLQDLYGIINFGDPRDVAALQQAVLPDEEPDEQPENEPAGEPEADLAQQQESVPDADTASDPPTEIIAPRKRGQIEEMAPRTGS